MLLRSLFIAAMIALSVPAFASEGALSSETLASQTDLSGYSYFRWGMSNDGYGRCYEYASSGGVLNQGAPQPEYYCERVSPSIPRWARSNDGYGRCYRYSQNGLTLNEGLPISEYLCERRSPSIYRWGRGNDGYTRCYHYTRSGLVLDQGRPSPDYLCRY